jgi:signal transduction histidine kinase
MRGRWLFIAGSCAVAALLLSLLAAMHMGASKRDTLVLALTLLSSGLGSLVLALVLLRVAERSPHIGLASRLLIPSTLAIAVMLLNVWFTAAMMFISKHDLLLLAALLSYAAIPALFAAFALAGSITGGLARLTDAVGRMANGETGVRVEVGTADEVGALGAAFNSMAARVEAADRQRRETDEARRALLAAVSHDLRTPLAAIRVMLEAIEDGVVEDLQTVERYHHAMQAEVSRLSTLIDDLFELTRIEAGALRLTMERMDISDLFAETMEAMRAEADRAGVAFSVELAPDLRPLTADTQLVYRVLRNLITNALRHTPPDGSVTLRADEMGEAVAITVADTGEGIAAEDLPHVFERFYRGDKSRSRAGGGAGLGLAIARGIVEAHGGSIRVESAPERGTAFTFTLPRTA